MFIAKACSGGLACSLASPLPRITKIILTEEVEVLGPCVLQEQGLGRRAQSNHLGTLKVPMAHLVSQPFDLPRGLVAVHDRHVEVHQDVCEGSITRFEHCLHRLLSVERSFENDPAVFDLLE